MKFRTEITIPSYPFNITYDDRLLFLGSCFSDHIGNYFKSNGFNSLVNPFGTLFNPFSIKLVLDMACGKEIFDERYIDFFNDRWISFAHHGKFSHPDKSTFLTKIQQVLDDTHRMLKQTDYLFITFGTAYHYRHLAKDLEVVNCHKIPAKEFEKNRLTVTEIVVIYQDLIQRLSSQNNELKIIFTVSPVRHLGDGFHENQLSKSILHIAIDELVDSERIFYFPAYEIVQDDLRDYRFYAKDLCHPSESGIDYIKEKLETVFFSNETLEKLREVEKINKLGGHREVRIFTPNH
ncbi:MAG: GSCFA domain-containing protein [Bacteroidales bacterium]|jgi:hypothetical protein|nr:GSCFA domain-containing protein [Bacteroidales bacterium]